MITRIHLKCPTCNKVAELASETLCGNLRLITYKCGHTVIKSQTEEQDPSSIVSLRGYKLYPFQIEGINAAEKANARFLLMDEMGLGKTMQALITLKLHPEITPFAVFCKSGLKTQWFRAIIEWMGDEYVPQVLDSGREKMYTGFKCYILSLDLLRRFNGALLEQFEECKVKTIVIDECQLIKNPNAIRTQEVRKLCGRAEHILALSGTPIKNHSAEFFPILNILRPDKFPSQRNYEWNWVSTYYDGYKMRYGGLRNPEKFKEYTKDFILRRTREEVLPDLPKVWRTYSFHDLGEEVRESYVATVKKFQQYYGNSTGEDSFTRYQNIMSFLARMRHLTGLAKIEHVAQFVQEFLESTDRKICIFVHHHDVGLAILNHMRKYCAENNLDPPIQLEGGMDSDSRATVQEQFNAGPNRVLVASTLAAGEGLNLHEKCCDCIMAELQWTPINEEQAECRFIRIGQTASKVMATYFIAIGTIDEWITELREHKRENVKQTLDGSAPSWDEASVVRELASILASKGGKKWGF